MNSEEYINDNGLLEIEGTVEHIVFRNDDNGYTVLDLDCDGVYITVVGSIPFINEGEKLKAVGVFKNHHSFGKQFQAEAYERFMPTDTQAICKYLSSGIIKGVGAVTAKKIVGCFGEDSLDTIENYPEKLTKVRGITKEKAQRISNEFKNISGIREVILYFFKFSITAQESIRVWKKFGIDAINEVKNDPYVICCEDINISFDKADDISQSLLKPVNDISRVQCGTLHVIKHNMKNGHTCIPKDKLIPLCSSYLQVEEEFIEKAIDNLISSEQLVSFLIEEREFTALKKIYDSERFCSSRLALMLNYPPCEIADSEDKIKAVESRQKIQYAVLQKKAIKNAMEKGLLIMTGGPGTGKTTTIKAIITILEKNSERVFLAAPTGRAAKRMSEVTGREAKTIHRLLGAEFDKKNHCIFTKNEKNMLNCDALILDELSMVDITIFEALLKALPLNCRLIMIGDSDQLPSVGAGNVLKDMIDSNLLPVISLNEIFRQSMESMIVTNAHKIVCGEYPGLNIKNKDFFFLEQYSIDDILQTISDLYIQRLPKSYNFISIEDIQILTPGRKGLLGSIEINKYIQNQINPKSEMKPEINKNGFVLRQGDKIMQIRNNYDITWIKEDGTSGEGVFNGDMGVIQQINKKTQEIVVRFDDRVVYYNKDNTEDLELAYAVTVHKSQGSEFKAVIMPMYKGAKQLYYRNLLYTAVTRAKKILIMVGSKKIVQVMVDNNRKTKRYTALNHFLKEEI